MTLYINCCVRKESRTNRLAKAVLQKLGEDYTELKLYEENLRPLNFEKLNRRTELIEREDFSDKMFDCAKQFANADTIPSQELRIALLLGTCELEYFHLI